MNISQILKKLEEPPKKYTDGEVEKMVKIRDSNPFIETNKHNCLESFYRAGRAQYLCTECGRDLTIELVLLAEIGHETKVTHYLKDGEIKPY